MSTSLQQAKSYLRANFKEGCACPACGQMVKLYKRKIHYAMSRALINLYLLTRTFKEREYFHITEFLSTGVGHDFTLFAHYDMVSLKKDDDNKKTSGYWKINTKGKQFVENTLKVPSHILLYNNKKQGFSDTLVSISETIGERFDYNELMETKLC